MAPIDVPGRPADFSRQAYAERFRGAHVPGRPLVLPHAWDAGSARVVAAAGATAVATTGAGVAWSHGRHAGGPLGRVRALDALARVAEAVDLPVTADLEDGYAPTADALSETVFGALDAGAVGITIAEGTYAAAQMCDRLDAVREAAEFDGLHLVVDVRVDGAGRDVGDVCERATAYLAVGADSIFVPDAHEPDRVRALVAAIDAPVHVPGGVGAPPVDELAALGVARVSIGDGAAVATYGLLDAVARDLLGSGRTAILDRLAAGGARLTYADLDALMLVDDEGP